MELVAVTIGSAVSIDLAMNSVSLDSGSPWDAEVEFIAVVV
jgi:hypothetical protein